MKMYELTYLISPNLMTEEIISLQNKLALSIHEKEGVLISSLPTIRKQLAFPIKKKMTAFLTTIVFQITIEGKEKLEKELTLENNILRYLLLNKVPPKKVKMKRKPLTDFKATEEKAKITEVKPEKTKEEQKIELKDIDKKLDEILK